MENLVAAFGGYLLGSVPFGLVLTLAAGLGDVRQIGSGNIGATNVLRTGNKKLAAATLILDGAKGAVAALVAWAVYGEDAALIAGFFAVLGHNFPVWLKFKGGKGVATTLGTLAAVAWPAALAAVLTWLAAAKIWRISSLSALVALGLSPVYAYLFAGPRQATLAFVLAALGFMRHKANIQRLLDGTEPRIGEKK